MTYITSQAGLEAYLAELIRGRSAVMLGKSYSIFGKVKTMADEKWFSDEIAKTQSRLSIRQNGRTLSPVFESRR